MKEQIIQQIERLAQEAQGRIKPSMLIKDRAYQQGVIDACHKMQDIINGMDENVQENGKPQNFADLIIERVCEVMSVSRTLLTGRIRRQNVVAARMVAALLLNEFTCLDGEQIGRLLSKYQQIGFYYLKQGRIRLSNDKGFIAIYNVTKKDVEGKLLKN